MQETGECSFLDRHIDVKGDNLIGSHLSTVKYCRSHISEIGASRNQQQKTGQEARKVEDRTHGHGQYNRCGGFGRNGESVG